LNGTDEGASDFDEFQIDHLCNNKYCNNFNQFAFAQAGRLNTRLVVLVHHTDDTVSMEKRV